MGNSIIDNFKWVVLIGILLLVGYIFLRAFPIILIAGLIIWSGFKLNKYYSSWKSKKNFKEDFVEEINSDTGETSFKFSNKEIVDVEYEEIKK